MPSHALSHEATKFRAAAAWAAGLLFLTNLVGYLDRSILTLLVQPVKASLRLTDGEMGLMLGAAFVVTFSLAGLFIGGLSDRLNRRNLLIVCVAIWSVSAAACGLAQNGVQLFIARMGVGVGEAAVYPIAVSLIADYFAADARGKPYGVFTMGVYAGGGLSLVLAGAVLPWAASMARHLPAVGVQADPWRFVMFLMLLPGAACCALLATMKEPARTHGDRNDGSTTDHPGLRDWLHQWTVFLPHHLFMSLVTLAMLATTAWMPTVLIREQSLALRSTGLMFGTVLAITGILSSSVGGLISDWAGRRGGPRGLLMMSAICVGVGTMGYVVLIAAQSTLMTMAGFVLAFSPLSMSLIAGILAMAALSPARSRGQITSIYFLFTGIIGTAGGPALVGFLNDAAGGQHSGALGRILSLTGLVATGIAVLIALFTLRRLRAGAVRATTPLPL